jgi:hypothetical protein
MDLALSEKPQDARFVMWKQSLLEPSFRNPRKGHKRQKRRDGEQKPLRPPLTPFSGSLAYTHP